MIKKEGPRKSSTKKDQGYLLQKNGPRISPTEKRDRRTDGQTDRRTDGQTSFYFVL